MKMIENTNLLMITGPVAVRTSVMCGMIEPIINHRSSEFHTLYTRIEGKLKKLFGTKNDVIVITSSGTGAVEASLKNFVEPGEKIIVPIYGIYGMVGANIAEKLGVNPKRCEVEWGKAPSKEFMSRVMDENSDAKALFIVYNETSTGVTVRDLGDISKDAARRGILVIVDAISILGGDQLPVDEWEIDVCLGATQKCLGLPPGLSLISISSRALRVARKNEPSTTYFNIPAYVDFLRERKETPYTPALPLFYALDKALSLILEEGLKSRFRRHRLCASALYEAIESIGLKPLAEKSCRSNVQVVFRSPEGTNVEELVNLMRERYGVVVNCFPPNAPVPLREMIRVGCMGEISPQMIYRTIQATSGALNDLGFKNDGVKAINVASKRLSSLLKGI